MVLLPPRTNPPTSLAWLSPLDLKPLSASYLARACVPNVRLQLHRLGLLGL